MKKHLVAVSGSRKNARFGCLLVNPPMCRDSCYDKTVAPMIPTQLLSIATKLRKSGVHTNVLDLAIMDDAFTVFEEIMAELKPQLIGFSNHTVINLDVIEELAKRAKESGAESLVGGINPTNMREGISEFVPSIDRVQTGFYGPMTVPDIYMIPYLKAYTNGLYPIESERGCEFNCTFCTSKMGLGRRPVRKQIELVIMEIKNAIRAGFREFFFTDNTFTGDSNYARQLCRRIIEERIEGQFIAMARLDCVDEETLAMMCKAGFRSLGLGYESASEEALDRYGKKLRHNKTQESLSRIKDAGIDTTAFVMTGGPDDTEETLESTYNDISRLMHLRILDFATVSMFRPFPGTPYYKNPEKYGIKFERNTNAFHDWGFFNGKAITETRHLGKQRIEHWWTKINELNPSMPELQV